jgi:hypothetical protein
MAYISIRLSLALCGRGSLTHSFCTCAMSRRFTFAPLSFSICARRLSSIDIGQVSHFSPGISGMLFGADKPRHRKSLTAPDEHVKFPAASGSITGPVYITVRYEPIDPPVHCHLGELPQLRNQDVPAVRC